MQVASQKINHLTPTETANSESWAKAQTQPAQADADFNPIHEIVKQVGFGNLANQPDRLNAIRAAAAMHGMGKEVDPWLDSLVASKKSGIFDAAMDLKRGNIDGAMDNLKRGGIQLEDRPSRVDPNDNSKWKVNISGTGEQTINLDDWATSTLDPEKYSKFLLDRQGVADKSRLTDAQIDNQKAGAYKDQSIGDYYRGAKSEFTRAQADRQGRMGMGLGSDRPEKIDAAIKRRDSTLDSLSSVTGDDGKPFVDPQKRMQYSSLAVDAEQAVSDMLGGRDLTAREQHKLTDMLRTAPLGNSQQMAAWAKSLQSTFGGRVQPESGAGLGTRPAPQPAPASTMTSAPAPDSFSAGLGGTAAPAALSAPPRLGGLAGLQEEQQLRNQMVAIQQALRNPNLTTQQKQALALQANEVQQQTDAYYGR